MLMSMMSSGKLESNPPLSSQVDFRASRSAVSDSEEAKTTLVTSGRRCLESCGSGGQLGLLERMLLESLDWHSTKSALTWKISDTPAGRLIYLLEPLEPTNSGGEFLWLPTMLARDLEKPLRRMCPSERSKAHGVMFVAAMGELLLPGVESSRSRSGREYLNPQLLEMVMGFPIGWTDALHSEMQSSLSKYIQF